MPDPDPHRPTPRPVPAPARRARAPGPRGYPSPPTHTHHHHPATAAERLLGSAMGSTPMICATRPAAWWWRWRSVVRGAWCVVCGGGGGGGGGGGVCGDAPPSRLVVVVVAAALTHGRRHSGHGSGLRGAQVGESCAPPITCPRPPFSSAPAAALATAPGPDCAGAHNLFACNSAAAAHLVCVHVTARVWKRFVYRY